MPHAVTHVIIALIIASFIRDYYIRKGKGNRKSFPLHYVLIAGLGGLLPDIDILAFWILSWFGFTMSEVHRTFTHTLFVPLIFLIIGLITNKIKNKELGRHHLKISIILLMLALGSFIHLALDASLAGVIRPFYPFSNFHIGYSVMNHLPAPLGDIFFPSLDAVLLILWLFYIEWRHRISDFI
jgi:membrane-bound metal-dependent hydrolase YbcI (DUF457 family)